MPWESARGHVAEAMALLASAPAATVLNLNVPAWPAGNGDEPLRWAPLDSFGSFRVSVGERRESLVQLEFTSTAEESDPGSDSTLVAAGFATLTAIDAIRMVPPDSIAFEPPRPAPRARLASAPSDADRVVEREQSPGGH